ncbi:MAG: thymidylate synthase [Eubacteriales bacterium]|nr:thymidylate synthase [Eubacteriales bacterium]
MMTKADRYLVRDIRNILENGYKDENPRPVYEDGTPAHTISVNHVLRKYDLSKGEFPLCTLRPQAWKTGIREIFTIYQHPTNVLSQMKRYGVTWWDPWDIGDGTIGQRYGATVKRYDLIHNLIADIQKDPYGRRKVVSLWQETDLHETPGLAPCAFLTMWNVRGEYLDMSMVQRSGDMLTASGAGGINEIQYAALLMMIACTTGYKPGVFTHFVANEQIYDRHMDNAHEMLHRAAYMEEREAKEKAASESPVPLPALLLHKEKGCRFEDITIGDFEMVNYDPLKPQLKFELGI